VDATAIDKPVGGGEYDSFAMSRDGRGRLTVYVAGTKDHPRRGGFYHFRTADGGQSWSRPEHERDDMTPADDVGDDDEPTNGPPAGQRAAVPSPR
jgi:hypothetical protein